MIRMGRGSKPEQSNEESTLTTPTSQPVRNAYQSGNIAPTGQALTESETMARDIKEGRLSGFVGSGTVLTGETNFESMLRIDGHLKGSVASNNGTLLVGSTGRVDANIKVAAAIINGTVNGDIVATERLELGRTARVVGNVHAPRLTVEDGAVLEGSCTMLKALEEIEKLKAAEASSMAATDARSYEASEEYATVDDDDDDDDLDVEEEEEDETNAEAATS